LYDNALIAGDGVGKLMGLLHPNSGIPICETSEATPVDRFSWQDLLALAYEVPSQWHSGAVYVMNQRTLALLFTSSDAAGRPMFSALVEGRPGPQFAGFPIVVANQMPDVLPGSTPILFGNLRSTYTIVDRQATTVLSNPHAAGYCHLFQF